MGMDASWLGAYWGDRRESAAVCAERLARCLAGLAGVNPLLSVWYRTARRRSAADVKIDTEAGALAEMLLADRTSSAGDRGWAVEKLGFTISLWNGADPQIGMMGLFGAYPEVSDVMNSFSLGLPPLDEIPDFRDTSIARRILKIMVDAWEPSWATWSSYELHDLQEPAARQPVVGVLTYLTEVGDSLDSVAHLPDVEPYRDGVFLGFDDAEGPASEVLELKQNLLSVGALRPA